jgi:mono/diheme cytochrome c family protein
MTKETRMRKMLQGAMWLAGSSALVLIVGGCVDQATATPSANRPRTQVKQQQILRGRQVVIEHDCGGCHGGGSDPSAKGWLAGSDGSPQSIFKIGPCGPGEPCFTTRPRNLTPDNTTGMGRFTDRQIFNAIRYGLRPGETPDVEITGITPGKGNFPANPKYLAPPMPWPAWRHMPDADLWAIAAYLKNGVKPVVNRVADSEGPPDFWASEYTVEKIGPYPAKPFPTANEKSQ